MDSKVLNKWCKDLTGHEGLTWNLKDAIHDMAYGYGDSISNYCTKPEYNPTESDLEQIKQKIELIKTCVQDIKDIVRFSKDKEHV